MHTRTINTTHTKQMYLRLDFRLGKIYSRDPIRRNHSMNIRCLSYKLHRRLHFPVKDSAHKQERFSEVGEWMREEGGSEVYYASRFEVGHRANKSETKRERTKATDKQKQPSEQEMYCERARAC